MKVNQLATLLNNVTKEVLGETAVTSDDLTAAIDAGRQALGATDIENYTRKLIDHIGKVLFVDRPYSGMAPSVLMDGTTYGSIVEKIDTDIPEAEDNPTWNLQDGVTYNQDEFTAPVVRAKFWNSKGTLQVKTSTVDRQVYSAFDGPAQVSAFIGMIINHAEMSLTVKLDGVIMQAIAAMIADTIYDAYGASGDYTAQGNTRAVNLLSLYNQRFGKSLTQAQAFVDPEFIRYAAFIIGLYKDRITKLSRLFNMGGYARHTPNDLLHVIFLSEFYSAASVYLQSDTFHDNFVRFPQAEVVPYWQGSGQTYHWSDTSRINVKSPNGHTVNLNGVLAVMFDRDALGVANMGRRTTTHWNASAEFLNSWFKMDIEPWNDGNENFVVFIAA